MCCSYRGGGNKASGFVCFSLIILLFQSLRVCYSHLFQLRAGPDTKTSSGTRTDLTVVRGYVSCKFDEPGAPVISEFARAGRRRYRKAGRATRSARSLGSEATGSDAKD